LAGKEFGSASGYEYAGFDGDAQAAKLGPPDDVLEGQARDASVDHGGQVGGGLRGRHEEARLVFGEDTAGCA
jgi:hypothetical protein